MAAANTVSKAEIIARFVLDLESPEESAPVGALEARENYAAYLRHITRGHYREAAHTRRLCEKLEAVERGEIPRLMVFMPPRHSKSETGSKHFPGWFLGRNPQRRVMVASYGDELSREFGRMNRDDLEEYGKEIFSVGVSPSSAAAHRWDLAGKRGGLVAAGVGGPLTGKGAHLMIIDDPYKDWEEAQSPTIRERVWNWYRSVAYTRLQKGGAIIIIQTRWHEDDLSGRLLAEAAAGGEKWEVLSLPAEAEENDLLGRAPGEPLWPEGGFDHDWIARTKRAVGSFIWAALFQQRPSPAEGGILKRHWWRFYKGAPARFDEVIQSWDMAFKDTATADFVVGQVWGKVGADKYLLDQVRDRMDFASTLTAVRTLSAKWPQARTKLVEDKANGPAVISALKREIAGLIPVEPQGGKIARATAASPEVEAGNIHLPDPSIAPWVHDFIEEATSFPNGAHDDQVDGFSQAIAHLSGRRAARVTNKPPGM